jgi:predicted ABC-type ATPase
VAGPPESIREREKQRWFDRLAKVEKPPNNREQLKDRLNQLEPGHPSSPWEDDGTPKPPAPRLTDLERPTPPLSDADYKAHVREVAISLDQARAAGLTTERLYTINPDRDIWSEDRSEIHDQILDVIYSTSDAVPCERRAIIAGGLGGAGKTTVLEKQAGIDMDQYLVINPDTFKGELARRGLTPEVGNLSPMETSALAHEESSYLAKQLAQRALADGKNVIWDVTMSSSDSTLRRIGELRDSGYTRVDGIFVDIPVETSIARMEARHRRGHDRFLNGEGTGGRYVPADVIRSQAHPIYGSVNRQTFEMVKSHFDGWSVYDNSVNGRDAEVVAQGIRDRRDI